jgi:hypothetical protein
VAGRAVGGVRELRAAGGPTGGPGDLPVGPTPARAADRSALDRRTGYRVAFASFADSMFRMRLESLPVTTCVWSTTSETWKSPARLASE